MLKLPGHDLRYLRDPDARSRSRQTGDIITVSLSLPRAGEAAPTRSVRRMLLVTSGGYLLTATSEELNLPDMVVGRISRRENAPLVMPTLFTVGVLEYVSDEYASFLHRYEDELYHLEEVRVVGGGPAFLNDAFKLQREIATAAGELWRLKGIVRGFMERDASSTNASQAVVPLRALSDEVDSLFDRLTELKDAVKALIELHMNVTSFEMNKFMKLLAIVGFLGLIPSVVGGLLGMNVVDNPWPVTLGQVAFGIAMGMAVSLYVFAVKGWLR